MKWITRRRIQDNRTATCWLVRRFLDENAEFIFVAPEEVLNRQAREEAVGVDARGATSPHKESQDRCSFAALVHERLAHDSALLEMARLVQAADFNEH